MNPGAQLAIPTKINTPALSSFMLTANSPFNTQVGISSYQHVPAFQPLIYEGAGRVVSALFNDRASTNDGRLFAQISPSEKTTSVGDLLGEYWPIPVAVVSAIAILTFLYIKRHDLEYWAIDALNFFRQRLSRSPDVAGMDALKQSQDQGVPSNQLVLRDGDKIPDPMMKGRFDVVDLRVKQGDPLSDMLQEAKRQAREVLAGRKTQMIAKKVAEVVGYYLLVQDTSRTISIHNKALLVWMALHKAGINGRYIHGKLNHAQGPASSWVEVNEKGVVEKESWKYVIDLENNNVGYLINKADHGEHIEYTVNGTTYVLDPDNFNAVVPANLADIKARRQEKATYYPRGVSVLEDTGRLAALPQWAQTLPPEQRRDFISHMAKQQGERYDAEGKATAVLGNRSHPSVGATVRLGHNKHNDDEK